MATNIASPASTPNRRKRITQFFVRKDLDESFGEFANENVVSSPMKQSQPREKLADRTNSPPASPFKLGLGEAKVKSILQIQVASPKNLGKKPKRKELMATVRMLQEQIKCLEEEKKQQKTHAEFLEGMVEKTRATQTSSAETLNNRIQELESVVDTQAEQLKAYGRRDAQKFITATDRSPGFWQ